MHEGRADGSDVDFVHAVDAFITKFESDAELASHVFGGGNDGRFETLCTLKCIFICKRCVG